jgi:hypothetical protein
MQGTNAFVLEISHFAVEVLVCPYSIQQKPCQLGLRALKNVKKGLFTYQIGHLAQ